MFLPPQLPDPTVITELEHKLEESKREGGQMKEKLSSTEEDLESCKTHLSRAQSDVKSLQEAQREQEEANTRLKEKLSRLEVRDLFQTRGHNQGRVSSAHS